MTHPWDPRMNFVVRSQQIEAEMAGDSRLIEIYRRAINRGDAGAIAAIQRKYAAEMQDYDPNGVRKYADIAYWIGHKARYAEMLDLDRRPPSAILDIGTGAGHLLAVANSLGHRSIGIDI